MRAPLILTAIFLCVAAAPAPPPVGPGGVLDAHVKLFAAIDAGDTEAIEALLVSREGGVTWDGDGWGEPAGFRAFLLDPESAPVTCRNTGQASRLLSAWNQAAPEAGGTWSTRIVDGWMDCPQADLSYAVLEIERTWSRGEEQVTKRYHATSLLSHGKGGFRLWHLQLAP